MGCVAPAQEGCAPSPHRSLLGATLETHALGPRCWRPRSPLPAAPGSPPPAPVSATFLWSGPVGTRNLARREHCDQGQEQPPRSRTRPEEDCRGSPWSTTPPSEGTETPGPASTPRMPRPPHRAPMGLACSEREARLEGQQSGTRGGQGPGTLTGRPPGTPRPPSGGRGHR